MAQHAWIMAQHSTAWHSMQSRRLAGNWTGPDNIGPVQFLFVKPLADRSPDFNWHSFHFLIACATFLMTGRL